jgi:hypothetical protein
MEPVIMELAAQVQSGPTAVSHSEMLREFKQRDVHRRGFLPVAEFKKALGKVGNRSFTEYSISIRCKI